MQDDHDYPLFGLGAGPQIERVASMIGSPGGEQDQAV
jgi:hypothetical protein